MEKNNEKKRKVVEIIKKGGIVITPTDTVYGVICDGFNSESKKRIYKIKKRSSNKPLIGFINTVEKAEKFVTIPEKFLSLVKKKWPGATTFIFESKVNIPFITSEENKIGLRIPDYPFLLDILSEFEIIASTSANLSGEKTPSSVDEISEEVKEKVDLIIDEGKTQGRESTIWDLTGESPLLLRGKILFVCEGNSCRSPMAEYILKEYLKKRKVKIVVESAGISIITQGTAGEKTFQVMREIGIDITGFYSKPLNFEKVEEADLIFTMEEKQKDRIISFFPEAKDKIITLNVPDPAGKEISYYRKTRDIIKKKIEEIVLKRIGK